MHIPVRIQEVIITLNWFTLSRCVNTVIIFWPLILTHIFFPFCQFWQIE